MEALRARIDDIGKYLSQYSDVINCHMVEFFTEDYWTKYIAPEIVDECEENGLEEAIEYFWALNEEIKKSSSSNVNIDEITNGSKYKNFSKYIIESYNYSLSEDDFYISFDDFNKKIKQTRESLRIGEFMSYKKSHEVEKLSCTLAQLFDWSDSTHIVDLGGGKGYLSAMLSMYYNIPVLNIDYSETNHKGAIIRNNKVEKLWSGIVKNAQNLKLKASDATTSDEALQQSIEKLTLADHQNTSSPGKTLALYKHVVEFVTEDTDLVKLINENFKLDDNQSPKLCMTGLHTCGGLGSNTLKIYTSCSSAAVLCTVPCCYNLLTEKDNTENQTSFDFPMSEHLKGIKMGRNARMLAAQSIDRAVAEQDLPTVSIFYRALLQLLIPDHCSKKGKMGKSGENIYNFPCYVKKARKKMKVDIIQDDTFLYHFEKDHIENERQMNIFYLMRMCLAPVIENLIILDRLMYLYEKGFDKNIGEAYLVKMFDPILSPRHTSLIAYKYPI